MEWITHRPNFDGDFPEPFDSWDNRVWEFEYKSTLQEGDDWVRDANKPQDRPLWLSTLVYRYRQREGNELSPNISFLKSLVEDLSLEEKITAHQLLGDMIDNEHDRFYRLAQELQGESVDSVAARLRAEFL
jgi:hypothetical protein